MSYLKIYTLFVVSVVLVSCSNAKGPTASSENSQISVDQGATCSGISGFDDQASCLAVHPVCQMSSFETKICWVKKDEVVATPTPITDPKIVSCDWNVGAWTPKDCAPGIHERHRKVECPVDCGECVGKPPVPTEACSPDLFRKVHYSLECVKAGGKVVVMDRGERVCEFPTKCPPQFQEYREPASAKSNKPADHLQARCF